MDPPADPGDGKRKRDEDNFTVAVKRKGRPPKKNRKKNRDSDKESTTDLHTDSDMDHMDTQNTPQLHSTQVQITNTTTQLSNPNLNNTTYQRPLFKHTYNITTTKEMSRIQFSQIWLNQKFDNTALIIKTKTCIIIKSNWDKHILIDCFNKLKGQNIIIAFTETIERPPRDTRAHTASYSLIIRSVELEIEDTAISEQLIAQGITHRYCRRIVSKATDQKTRMIRIITSCHEAYSKLLQDKFRYLCKIYPVEESHAPEPMPIPCNKCEKFTHKTADCIDVITCGKCKGPHHTNDCSTTLPDICKACGEEGHRPWSVKCKQRPFKPIEGIPNVRIRSMNKKSHEIGPVLTKSSRVHQPMSLHDHIIDIYTTKINSPSITDRQDLIKKLRNRFIESFRIDTHLSFSGNKMFVVMFDLDFPDEIPPVVPHSGVYNSNAITVING